MSINGVQELVASRKLLVVHPGNVPVTRCPERTIPWPTGIRVHCISLSPDAYHRQSQKGSAMPASSIRRGVLSGLPGKELRIYVPNPPNSAATRISLSPVLVQIVHCRDLDCWSFHYLIDFHPLKSPDHIKSVVDLLLISTIALKYLRLERPGSFVTPCHLVHRKLNQA
ncbi:hypothetical protein K432DRAFT_21824 [Lepidopterella palustris CBS 459.81]|uniref:Uncharacterized protein n=1 Tax=Lepidopterella palustris CBS 459.81 TaxID=1314670 RepID=A0A8E2JG88_9PEZI|nr:hypothetical protein K432DRAFT_21824 [Lepidopterella palustris CBS 459.81]